MTELLDYIRDDTGPLRGAMAIAFLIGAFGGPFLEEGKPWDWRTRPIRSAFELIVALCGAFSLLGILVVFILDVATWGFPRAVSLLLSPHAFLPALAAAAVLFWLRGRLPFMYGLIECAVAIVAIWAATHGRWTSTSQHLITIVGGVYFLIRGLDNVEKGLPAVLRPSWDRVFPKRPTTSSPPQP